MKAIICFDYEAGKPFNIPLTLHIARNSVLHQIRNGNVTPVTQRRRPKPVPLAFKPKILTSPSATRCGESSCCTIARPRSFGKSANSRCIKHDFPAAGTTIIKSHLARVQTIIQITPSAEALFIPCAACTPAFTVNTASRAHYVNEQFA